MPRPWESRLPHPWTTREERKGNGPKTSLDHFDPWMRDAIAWREIGAKSRGPSKMEDIDRVYHEES